MKAVIQRVSFAEVRIGGEVHSRIEKGFLILLGVCGGDGCGDAEYLARKISALRIFKDDNDKMNLSLKDVGGSVLVVSNFTLCADTSHGNRPSFVNAAEPETADRLYEYFISKLKEHGLENVRSGVFGADMKVSLLNDGPVTIIMESRV